MSDELGNDLPKESARDFISPEPSQPSSSLFNTFISGIKTVFTPQPVDEPKVLTGRFQNSKQLFLGTMTALEVTLQRVKERGGKCRTYAEAILLPLLKEGEKLSQSLSQAGVEQVKSVKLYHRWIEQTTLWLLHFETLDEEELQNLYIKQSMQDAVNRVDKDLQLVNEYMQQQFTMLEVSEEEKQQFESKVEEELGLYLFELRALKIELPNLSLEELDNWKAELNKRRETYFNAALSVIDRNMARKDSFSHSEDEHHYLTDLIKQIVAIEEKLPQITEILKVEGLGEVRLAMETQIISLKEKAHLLSLDLRLPLDFQDRLEEVINTLEGAEKILKRE